MLTLAQVRDHLRVDEDNLSDDALIANLISAAYQFAENYTNRVILQRTETLKLDCFESVIELPYAPVISVTSVAYKDTGDASQTFTDYYLNLRDLLAKMLPKIGFSWPDTNQDYENVVVTYEVGYAAIPEQIDQAILLIIGSLYSQRENHITGVSINTIPVSAEYLLTPYRIVSV